MVEERLQRRLAAILAADVVGYSRLMGIDEAGTLKRLKTLRRGLIDPAIAAHAGRIVKLMGDGVLVEFGSAVDAVACAIEIQQHVREHDTGGSEADPIQFRIGINVGDIIIEDDDIFGDGVNIAARIESVAAPGGVSPSEDAWRQVQGKVPAKFVDGGEQSLKNIAHPVRVYRVELGGEGTAPPAASSSQPVATVSSVPNKPSIAVLPFQNMSGDPEQDYFCDGLVEDIITTLSKLAGLRVIARNSSFVYKGRAVDIREAANQLGVRYVLEGSVRKSGNRIRITAQFIDANDGAHVWAERYDRALDDIFAVQDEITLVLATEMQVKLTDGEQARRATRRPTMSRPGPTGCKGYPTTDSRSPKSSGGECVLIGKKPLPSIHNPPRSMLCSVSYIMPTPASAGGTTATQRLARRAPTPTGRSNSTLATPMHTPHQASYYCCKGATTKP
jgi:adenylate cyclase